MFGGKPGNQSIHHDAQGRKNKKITNDFKASKFFPKINESFRFKQSEI